ncbi:Cystathionine gamma-synthase [Marasmius sp. AFHP31]|nr:Cystathionine gamma-synthase [Marasmius sp. AFHP31]
MPDTALALGSAVPPFTPHAISVSLPTWKDNVGYEEGEKRVMDAMVCGYPRFFIHPSIRKLAQICEQKFGAQGEQCLLFPTKTVAEHCRSFIHNRSSQEGKTVPARLIQLLICPEDKGNKNGGVLINSSDCTRCGDGSASLFDIHIVLFPEDAFPLAKQFWQHAGSGISSRLAEHCLALLPDVSPPRSPTVAVSSAPRYPQKVSNRHYSVKEPPKISNGQRNVPTGGEALDDDYLEERYGRNLPITAAATAKRALRRRISGILVRDDNPDAVPPSTRGVTELSEDDVYVYPTGMNAIWSAHQLALATLPPANSVCFGFPYTDTLKVLQKWGPGCHFFGNGTDDDLDDFEALLQKESSTNPDTPPVLALFTEFPSNPLLRSADLPRLRQLADRFGFLIVIDETIGNFMNVEVLSYADIVVSSLTKVFSGASNVMGGSLVLNPQSRHYATLKETLRRTYEDCYFDQDAIFMERNSRDFDRRIKIIDANAEAICDFLHSRSGVIKQVFYPKYITPEHYEPRLLKDRGGGYGGLFSITFTSAVASEAFFDNLACYKGPSLGTNFTLACPFTILAHYGELDWAEEFGVERGLVRVSVGLEERGVLVRAFEGAVVAAERAAGVGA